MKPQDYNPEQRKDIEERVEKAKVALKELHLRPAVIMQPINMGNDVFGMKPIPYLADEKYTSTVSPLTP
jgi:hypothetical protein